MLLAGLLGGCSSDFSRFTDGIGKSSAPQRQPARGEPFAAYPAAPGENKMRGTVESSALPPPAPVKVSGFRAAPAEEAVPRAAEPRRAAETERGRKKIIYNVVSGDSLIGIGARYKVSVASIKRENGLKGDKILIGQKLTLADAAAPAVSAPLSFAAAAEKTAAAKPADIVPLPKAEPAESSPPPAAAHNDAGKGPAKAEENKTGEQADAAARASAGSASAARHEPLKSGAAAAWSAPAAAQESKAAENKNSAAEGGAAGISGASAAPKPVESSAPPMQPAPGGAAAVKPASSSAPMIWPLKGNIISGYGQRTGTTTNDGIDISVAEGTPVKAAAAGTVIYAGDGLKEFGNTILIRHDDNIVTVYGHNSKLLVSRGQQVKQGDVIAQSGSSGNASAAKLHFEVRQNSAPVNPMRYLPAER